jgi:nucleoside-diphosphate-sugar epimerase
MAVLGRSLARRRFVWVGTGENRKSPIAVDDVARACVTIALDREDGCGVFNLAGPPVTVRELVEVYSGGLQVPVPSWRLPAGLVQAGFRLVEPASIVVPGLTTGRAAIDAWLSTDVFDTTRYEERYGNLVFHPWRDSLRAEAEWIARA